MRQVDLLLRNASYEDVTSVEFIPAPSLRGSIETAIHFVIAELVKRQTESALLAQWDKLRGSDWIPERSPGHILVTLQEGTRVVYQVPGWDTDAMICEHGAGAILTFPFTDAFNWEKIL